MAYTPTEWNTGDLITAEKLNKLEQGVQNEQVGPQGPKGEPGAGLTGEAVSNDKACRKRRGISSRRKGE